MTTDRGTTIFNWINEQLNAGRTVQATTYLTVTRIKPKHRDMLRVRNGHCEVQRGKHWDSINYCKITAY